MANLSWLAAAAPIHDERHGPLPALLLVFTMATGRVDSMSYLKLGDV